MNIYNRSKFSTFRKVKHLLYKHYLGFVKNYKNQSNSTSNRFFVVLYECIPNMNHIWIIHKFVRKCKILQVGTSKNQATILYSETIKTETNFWRKNYYKNAGVTNDSLLFKGYASIYNIEILDSFNFFLSLNIPNILLK